MKKLPAFTLVELLVVISIIALLLAILMPTLNKARQQGKAAVCGYNTKMLNTSNQVYANEWNGWCVPFKIVNARTTLIYKWDGELWFQNPSFRKYMNYDSRKNNDPTHEIDMSLDKKFRCPADNRKEEDFFHNSVEVIKVSIGYNYTGLTRDWKWPSAEVIGFKFAAVTRPAVKIAFIDSTDCGVNELVADYRQYWDKYGNLAWKYNWMNVPAYRHLGGAEIGFFDLHVEYRKKQQCFLRDSRGRVNTKANDLIWRPDDYPKD